MARQFLLMVAIVCVFDMSAESITMLTLGIYIATNRVDFWAGLFDNLVSAVDFEIVLVGPNCFSPLPKHVRHIQSSDTVAKCFHIGAMSCDSKYIMNMADDCRLVGDFSLDRLVNNIEQKDQISMVSPFYKQIKSLANHTFLSNKPVDPSWNPLMPVCGLMHKDVYVQMGGIDRRFTNLYWDLDLAMRIYEHGGDVFVDESVVVNDIVATNLARRSKADFDLVISLWAHLEQQKWIIHKCRKDAVQPFEA
jgi:hypothetical protein